MTEEEIATINADILRINGEMIELQEKLDNEIGANALMQEQCNQYASENTILQDTLLIYRRRLMDAGLPTD